MSVSSVRPISLFADEYADVLQDVVGFGVLGMFLGELELDLLMGRIGEAQIHRIRREAAVHIG
jgi:hypothetical protein